MIPPATILLRTFNAGADLPALLERLREQSRKPHELLVVDSGSTDGTPDRARRAGARIVTLSATRFTHAVSTNLGFREARGEVVVMLSQDAIPADRRWLEALLEPLEDSGVAAVFGRQLPRPRCFPLERWELERSYPASPPAALPYSNVNSAARRSVWETVPFDESVQIAEDRLWAQAVEARGHRIVYCPAAAVTHSHTYTVAQVYARCRAESRARLTAEGERTGLGLLFKAWPKQTVRDARRLIAEGTPGLWPRAAVYRLAQFAGMVAGGRP